MNRHILRSIAMAVFALILFLSASASAVGVYTFDTLPGSPGPGAMGWITDGSGVETYGSPAAGSGPGRHLVAWTGSQWVFVLKGNASSGPAPGPETLIRADQISFDPSTNPLVADDMQQAIEEMIMFDLTNNTIHQVDGSQDFSLGQDIGGGTRSLHFDEDPGVLSLNRPGSRITTAPSATIGQWHKMCEGTDNGSDCFTQSVADAMSAPSDCVWDGAAWSGTNCPYTTAGGSSPISTTDPGADLYWDGLNLKNNVPGGGNQTTRHPNNGQCATLMEGADDTGNHDFNLCVDSDVGIDSHLRCDVSADGTWTGDCPGIDIYASTYCGAVTVWKNGASQIGQQLQWTTDVDNLANAGATSTGMSAVVALAALDDVEFYTGLCIAGTIFPTDFQVRGNTSGWSLQRLDVAGSAASGGLQYQPTAGTSAVDELIPLSLLSSVGSDITAPTGTRLEISAGAGGTYLLRVNVGIAFDQGQ